MHSRPSGPWLNANRGRGVDIGPGGQFVGFTITNAYESVGAALRVSGSGTVIRNNLIVGNTVGLQVDFGTDSQSAVWENNLVFGNGTDYQGITSLTGQAGNLSADPLFHNAAAGDFHLRRLSPAVDAGSSAGAPTNDLENVTRPIDGNGDGTNAVDIGAYEFQLTLSRPPTGLTAVSGDRVVLLTWQAGVDVTSYHVKRATNSGGPYTLIGTVQDSSYADTNVINDLTFPNTVSWATTRSPIGLATGPSPAPLGGSPSWSLP